MATAVYRVEIDIEFPLEAIRPPAGTERVACSVTYGADRLGMLELPVCDGVVCASVLADAVSAKWAWTILGLFFASNVYPSVVSRQEDGEWRAERGPSSSRKRLVVRAERCGVS